MRTIRFMGGQQVQTEQAFHQSEAGAQPMLLNRKARSSAGAKGRALLGGSQPVKPGALRNGIRHYVLTADDDRGVGIIRPRAVDGQALRGLPEFVGQEIRA